MSRVRRSVASAAIVALFAALTVVGAGSVAAATAPPCYATALNSGGQNAYCPPDPASAAAAAGYAYITPYVYAGVPYAYSGVPYYYQGGYAYTGVPVTYSYPYAYGGGAVYGYTAAGPIVGFDGNGAALVYDVRGGTIDPYVIGPNGKYCEANNRGQCI